MLNDLRQYSYNIYSQGIMTYLLGKYVDKNFWLEKIRPFFNDCSINNLTDFNYSKCFNTLINFSFIHFDPGSEEYNFYLKNNVIYGLRIEISTLGPFAACWYIKHYVKNNKQEFIQKESPFLSEHKKFDPIIKSFLESNDLTRLKTENLALRVPELSLELSQNNTTVYNCLFHDSSL